jgi:probable F420-dependent oxidoreductase
MAFTFGAHYNGPLEKARVVAFAQRLEALGFDSFWSPESSLNADCFPILAAAAAVTDLRIGTAVAILPFREPVLTARTVATLDRLSGGRFTLGVGVGGERRWEFKAYNIEPRERGPRTNEALSLMLRLWQESDVTFEGRFFKTEATSLGVRPLQQPHPPIWVGGRLGGQGKSRDAALRRVARYGEGWLPYLVSPEQYSAGIERLTGYAAERGRSADQFSRALQVNVAIYPTRAEALDAVMGGSARGYSLTQDQVERFYAFGNVEEVTQKLAAYVAAGAEQFVVQWACRPQDVDANLTALASEVIPELRKLTGPAPDHSGSMS